MFTEDQKRVLDGVLQGHKDEMWGFFGKPDVVIVIGKEFSGQERSEIEKEISLFEKVYFLCGWTQESYQEDPNLIQRVLFYEGTLPNWNWSLGAGPWRKFIHECD